MKSKIFEKVTLFIVVVVAVFGLYTATVPRTEACSMYDSYSCGSYAPSNYGDYYNYWPYPSTTSGCGTCGSYYGGNFDYGFQYPTYQYPSYQYQNYPSYQYAYNQPTYRPQNQYNYVQYPYYQYTYFQNPAPANSADVYNYVQYPYQMYVYNR